MCLCDVCRSSSVDGSDMNYNAALFRELLFLESCIMGCNRNWLDLILNCLLQPLCTQAHLLRVFLVSEEDESIV